MKTGDTRKFLENIKAARGDTRPAAFASLRRLHGRGNVPVAPFAVASAVPGNEDVAPPDATYGRAGRRSGRRCAWGHAPSPAWAPPTKLKV